MIIAILGLFVSLFFLFFFIERVGTLFSGLIISVLAMILLITFLCLDNHFIEEVKE